ncbi:MAG: hypothetical protein ACRC1M_06690 [Methanobacteriaceae archaeon]
MVRTASASSSNVDAVNGQLFLGSIADWYPKGVNCSVSAVKDIYKTDKGDLKLGLIIYIMDKLEKCRTYELDEDNKPVQVKNKKSGKMESNIIITSNPEFASLPLKVKEDEGDEEGNQEYYIHPNASLWPLLNAGFIKSGDLTKGNTDAIICTHEEMVEALSGFEFKATAEEREYQGVYYVLIPKEVDYKSETIEDTESKEAFVDDTVAKGYLEDAETALEFSDIILNKENLLKEVSSWIIDKSNDFDKELGIRVKRLIEAKYD